MRRLGFALTGAFLCLGSVNVPASELDGRLRQIKPDAEPAQPDARPVFGGEGQQRGIDGAPSGGPPVSATTADPEAGAAPGTLDHAIAKRRAQRIQRALDAMDAELRRGTTDPSIETPAADAPVNDREIGAQPATVQRALPPALVSRPLGSASGPGLPD